MAAASEVDAQDLRLEVDETVADPAFRAQVGGCAWVLKLFFPSLVGDACEFAWIAKYDW